MNNLVAAFLIHYIFNHCTKYIWNLKILWTAKIDYFSGGSNLVSFLRPKPGHRLPWSQVLGEKLAPLAVGYTQRIPYLLLHNKLSIPNSQGSSQLLTLSIPSILEGWTSHLFYPIKVLGWVPPGLNQVEPVPKGAKCQQPGLRKSEPAKVLQKAHQSSKRLVVLR